MAIEGFSEIEIREILSNHLTPSTAIEDPHRLFGRDNMLKTIERSLNSEGRHVFIYGDKGVGKTSLAKTAARLNNIDGEVPIYIPCGSNISFFEVIQYVGREKLNLNSRLSGKSTESNLKINLPGFSIDKKI